MIGLPTIWSSGTKPQERNIALYKRCIVNYEHNKLEVKDSKVYINGIVVPFFGIHSGP